MAVQDKCTTSPLRDGMLSQYDSYYITEDIYNVYGEVKVTGIIVLVSNKWYKFNKTLKYRFPIDTEKNTYTTTDCYEKMLARCKKHFGV